MTAVWTPAAEWKPANTTELADWLADAQAQGQAVYPIGGGTAFAGNPIPTKPGILLHTSKLTQVVAYPWEDLTITVAAGMTLAELATILAEQNQCLPLDAPFPDHATVGGLLATAFAGSRRFGFGLPRDYVLGLEQIQADGTRLVGGGRVVKNVAGYDTPKLQLGAYGTLGVISQVTLRLRPLTPHLAGWVLVLPKQATATALDWLASPRCQAVVCDFYEAAGWQSLRSQLLPPTLHHLPALAADQSVLVVLFAGMAAAVAGQSALLRTELTATLASVAPQLEWYEIEAAQAPMLLRALTHFPALGWVDPQSSAEQGLQPVEPMQPLDWLTIKITTLPSLVVETCQQLQARLPVPSLALGGQAGNGILWGHAHLSESTATSLAECAPALHQLADWLHQHEGQMQLSCIPNRIDWQPMQFCRAKPVHQWMQQLRQMVDPTDRINPHRLPFPKPTQSPANS